MKPLTAKTLIPALRLGDGIVLVLFLMLALGSFWASDFSRAGAKSGAPLTASIIVNDKEIAARVLTEAAVFDIAGPQGAMTLQIANNSIRVQHSSCANQICVKQGAARRSGEMLVCVPNRVVIYLRGERLPSEHLPQESRGDAITR